MMKEKPETEWINTVLKKGTIADKLAARTLLIHESKDWSSLNSLIAMVDPKKCRRQCVMAMSTLKELFTDSLNTTKRGADFNEDDKKRIKFYLTRFIDQLNLVAFDEITETRRKALWILRELLHGGSESQDYIIEKLINKVGDKVPRIATTAGHFVEKAANNQKDDVRSKTIIAIQKFLNRPNQGSQARFYAVSLLSRIKLFRGNHNIANSLIETYLKLYTTLAQEENSDTRFMSTILVGIHRAYPYSKYKPEEFEEILKALYKMVHQVNFRSAIVAMCLIKSIISKRNQKGPVEDRFYNLVFNQIINPDLQTCSRHQAFADLVLALINEDNEVTRKEAFAKRILQVALNSPPQLATILLNVINKATGLNVRVDLDSKSRDDVDGILARGPKSAGCKQLNELYLLRRYYDNDVCQLAKLVLGEIK